MQMAFTPLLTREAFLCTPAEKLSTENRINTLFLICLCDTPVDMKMWLEENNRELNGV